MSLFIFYLLKTIAFFINAKNARAFMKGGICMITFTILMIILAILMVVSVIVISVGGAAFIIVFGDIIVCVFILIWIIKKIFKKK